MAEGKTLAPTAPCSLCEVDDSVNSCVDCGQDLCYRCAKGHRKIGDTSHHKLISIHDKETTTAKPNEVKAYCSYHTSKLLSVICEQCLCALCDSCADSEHRNHKLLRTNLRTDQLHRVCAQKVPEFMELLQQLDKQNDGTPSKLAVFRTARDKVKSWREDVLKIIEDDCQELLRHIDEEIKKQEALLSDLSSKLKDAMKNTDEKMLTLSHARKIADPGTLMSHIHEGDDIIKNGRSLLGEFESARKVYTLDDLLPYHTELNKIKKNMHTFFKMTLTKEELTMINSRKSKKKGNTGTSQNCDYQSLVKYESYHIGDLSADNSFRISETKQQDPKAVVLYEVSTEDIHVFNTGTKQITRYTCAKQIKRMTTLSESKHVIVEGMSKDVHLLDESFSIVCTLDRDHEGTYEPCGVSAVSTDTFMLLEKHSSGTKTRFCQVTVSLANTLGTCILWEVDFEAWYGLLSMHPDLKQVTVASSNKAIRTLDVTSGKYTTLVLRGKVGNIYSLCVDESDQILLGECMSGEVHVAASTKYGYELKNMENLGAVSGLLTRGGKVVTIVGEYIHVYK